MPTINLDSSLVEPAARLLVEGFRTDWPESWSTLEKALEEVHECLSIKGGFARAYVDDAGVLLGWIGGRPEYDGRVWELHPLVVDPQHQGRGIGSALVRDLEAQVALRGGLTIMLGSDDVNNLTNLGGVDVYPEIWRHIAGIKNLRRHPFEFYQKQGFVIMGILPDANGYGKPDIYMAKRVGG